MAPRGPTRPASAQHNLLEPSGPRSAPARPPPAPRRHRPRPRPPRSPGGRPCGKWGGEVPLQSRPGLRIWTLDVRLDSLECLPPSHTALTHPPSPSNFPFSSSGRSDPLPALPRAKTGAGSPLPVATLSDRAPAAVQHSAVGLSLLTRNLGRDSL